MSISDSGAISDLFNVIYNINAMTGDAGHAAPKGGF